MLRVFVDQHGLLVFCVLTFVVGLPLFAVFPAASPALRFPLLILGSCTPALSAFLTTSFSQDHLARLGLKARLLRWRVAGPWYFFALLLPTVACLGISLGFNLDRDTGWLASLLAFPLIFLTNYTEEIGWRGYALPRLMQRHSAFTASLWLGLIWTVFHAPLYWDRPIEGLLLLAPILPLSVLITWLFVSSDESVVVTTVFHASFNTWVLVLAAPGSTQLLLVGVVIVFAVLAVTLRLLNGPGLTGQPQ